VVVSWSGGKDSSLALNDVRKDPSIRIAGLLTTVTRDYDRISMHGVRRVLLERQASSIGLPLFEVSIPKNATNEIYERQTTEVLELLKEEKSISGVVFGDLFLEDIKTYREKLLSKIGLECIFPIWGRDTMKLTEFFIEEGFRAILCTVNPKLLDPKFCGREFDSKLLTEMPASVDPCGENGEFHTFVYGGPIFKNEIKISRGEVVSRDGFYFADLVPSENG
jgi:uncharacterized protein (TIGR00290 family)